MKAGWGISKSSWDKRPTAEARDTGDYQPGPMNRAHPAPKSREGSIAAPGSGHGRTYKTLRWVHPTQPGSPLSSSLTPHSGPKTHTVQHSHCLALCISVPGLPEQSTTDWVAKPHTFILAQFWRLEVEIQLLAELVPSEGHEGKIRSRPQS